MSAFSDQLDRFLAEFFRIEPLRATAAGMHDYDGLWPDVSPAGRLARLAVYDDWTRRLAAFPDAASIYEVNMKTLQRLGHEGWNELNILIPE